jgi:predicted alpha/beta hydrolase family esterase
MTRLVFVPGWHGSGKDHWQSHWERALPGAHRIIVDSWDHPNRHDWICAIERAVRATSEPPIVIAHSLGCVAVAHWAATTTATIRGAFLVAPADLERAGAPDALREFGPPPRERLPFVARLVASDNDPHIATERARQLANDWDASFVLLRSAGHINTESGHGAWPEGLALLRNFFDVNDASFQPSEPDDSAWICRGID